MEGNSTVLSKGPGDKKHGGCSACSTDEHPDDRLPGPPLAPAPAPAPVPGPKACGNERGLLTTDLDNLRCQHLHLVRQHAPLDGLKQGGSRPSSLWWGWEGGYLRGGRSGLEGLNRLSVAWMKGRQEWGRGAHKCHTSQKASSAPETLGRCVGTVPWAGSPAAAGRGRQPRGPLLLLR